MPTAYYSPHPSDIWEGPRAGKDSMPSDVFQALEKILDACNEEARKLREKFEMVIPGENYTWEKRYAKVIRVVVQRYELSYCLACHPY